MRLLYRLFILALSVCYATVALGEIRFVTHPIRPFTYLENGEFRGFAVDVVQEMMREMDHSGTLSMFPFSRALLRAQEGTETAVFIVARMPDRENTVKWVGPLVTSTVYLYKRKDSPFTLNSLEDARELTFIGVGRGNSDHTFLADLGYNNLFPTNKQQQSLRMLYAGRVDAIPISEMAIAEMAKSVDVNMELIERTDVRLYDSVLYLVFSKDVPDAEVAKWQQVLDELKASGRYQAIYNRYIHQPSRELNKNHRGTKP